MRRIEIPTVDFEAVPGPAPMLQWIEIKDLVIDEAYQRDLTPRNWAAIRRIAANFKWSRFSPVFCAPVERLAEIRKRRLQSKLVAMTGKEALRLAMLDYLDKHFPQQVAA